MAQTTAATYEILISPAQRWALRALVLAKPQGRYIAPAAQALGNRIGAVFATVSWANRLNYVLPDAEFSQLLNSLKQEADQALASIGVTTAFEAAQTAGQSLTVSTTVTRGTEVMKFPFTFSPVQADFSPNWSEMRSIAKTRWERYKNMLTDADVQAIFDLAKQGYSLFLTGDSAAEQKAKLKHAIAMERLKAMPSYYIQRLDPAKYDAGYGMGADKYKELTQNIAFPSILYGFEYAKAVLEVL